MHPNGRLTPFEQGKIIALWEEKKTVSAIAKRLERSRDAVRKFLLDPDSYGKNKAPGRKKKVTERIARTIRRQAASGSSSSTIAASLSLEVSPRTVRRVLRDTPHLVYKRRLRTPHLTKQHKAKRLEWAKKMVDYGEQWSCVVFTDEKKFNFDGPDGCQYYWHDLRKDEETFLSRQQGGGSVMVWAGISARGKTKIAFLEGKQNSEKYIDTISEFLLPYAHLHYGTDFVLQQDNASIHVSRDTSEFLLEQEVIAMEWPVKSPDLNPIENMWGILVRRVYAGGRQYHNHDDLRSAIQAAWDSIPQQTLRTLVASMKNRCIQVIERKGAKSSY